MSGLVYLKCFEFFHFTSTNVGSLNFVNYCKSNFCFLHTIESQSATNSYLFFSAKKIKITTLHKMNSEINGNNVSKVNMKRTHDVVMGSPNKTSPKSESATWSNKRHGDQISGSPPKKKIKNGAPAPQPKNSVAMLNELRQGLIYTLEGQSGPVHAPIFTMSVEVIRLSIYPISTFHWSN